MYDDMRNLLLTISYKGSNYHGFQVQKNAVTISQIVQEAIESILNHKIDLKGCSRTDVGVHANMYCISLKTYKNISCYNFVQALNTKLPYDICAMNCEDVDLDVHARYSCKKKEYVYKIWNERYPSPFLFDLAYHYKRKINEEILNLEAKDFIGTYDFKAFCNLKKVKNINDTIRTIYDAEVTRDGSMVIFRVCGNGFLYNMVRIMVGTLLGINEGKIKQNTIKNIINSQNRKLAGRTALAKGLYLNKVYY